MQTFKSLIITSDMWISVYECSIKKTLMYVLLKLHQNHCNRSKLINIENISFSHIYIHIATCTCWHTVNGSIIILVHVVY